MDKKIQMIKRKEVKYVIKSFIHEMENKVKQVICDMEKDGWELETIHSTILYPNPQRIDIFAYMVFVKHE